MCAYALASYAYPIGESTEGLKEFLGDVLNSLGDGTFEVVWGAVAPVSALQEGATSLWNVALVVVARKENTNQYIVIVRGTNPFSVDSWVYEDFDVSSTVPWKPGKVPFLAEIGKVSKATDTAFRVHTTMKDGETNLLGYLTGVAAQDHGATFSFTGHSLGGCIAPVLAQKFAEIGKVAKEKLSVYAFAGPTPGDATFADYMTETYHDFQEVAFIRDASDIVPHAWNDGDLVLVKDLYPQHPITGEIWALLFLVRGLVSPHNYTHAFPGFVELLSPQKIEGAVTVLSGYDTFTETREQFEKSAFWKWIEQEIQGIDGRFPGNLSLVDTAEWFLCAIAAHVYPYLCFCEDQAQKSLLEKVLRPLYFASLLAPQSL